MADPNRLQDLQHHHPPYRLARRVLLVWYGIIENDLEIGEIAWFRSEGRRDLRKEGLAGRRGRRRVRFSYRTRCHARASGHRSEWLLSWTGPTVKNGERAGSPSVAVGLWCWKAGRSIWNAQCASPCVVTAGDVVVQKVSCPWRVRAGRVAIQPEMCQTRVSTEAGRFQDERGTVLRLRQPLTPLSRSGSVGCASGQVGVFGDRQAI